MPKRFKTPPTEEWGTNTEDGEDAGRPVQSTISILTLEEGHVQVYLTSKSPLLMNPMNAKAKQQILFPPRKLNKAEKETTLKHEPLVEFQHSIYRLPDTLDEKGQLLPGPTYLALPATSFKEAMRAATVDMPGATKAEIGRLVYIEDDWVPIWGLPLLHMGVVRNSDMK